VGVAKALELCVSGRQFTAAEALNIGVFNQLFQSEVFDVSVNDYCESLASGAPLAIAAIKRALYDGAAMPLEDALKFEADLADQLYDTADASEGLNAFLEKRLTVFLGH
jgi:2-(1,2-epoxy-1,2-dihydrophenyl)acetyl-CoA isomerase